MRMYVHTYIRTRDVTIYRYITILWYIKPVIQYQLWLSCIYMSNIGIYWISCMIYPCFGLNTAYSMCTVLWLMLWLYASLQFCNCLVSIKHDGFGKKAPFICKNHAIYRCIMIQRRWYIDTPKMCIVASLIRTHVHAYIHTYVHTYLYAYIHIHNYVHTYSHGCD